ICKKDWVIFINNYIITSYLNQRPSGRRRCRVGVGTGRDDQSQCCSARDMWPDAIHSCKNEMSIERAKMLPRSNRNRYSSNTATAWRIEYANHSCTTFHVDRRIAHAEFDQHGGSGRG